MATLQYETDGNTDLDLALTRVTRRIIESAVDDSDTIAALSERLGIGYRRTATLLRAFDLRDKYRAWVRKPE